MAITFENRQVWRGRGRPPRKASDRALSTCRQTARTQTCAVLEITPETSAKEIRDLYADLRAAERELGGKVSVQKRGEFIQWFWTPPRRADA